MLQIYFFSSYGGSKLDFEVLFFMKDAKLIGHPKDEVDVQISEFVVLVLDDAPIDELQSGGPTFDWSLLHFQQYCTLLLIFDEHTLPQTSFCIHFANQVSTVLGHMLGKCKGNTCHVCEVCCPSICPSWNA